MTEKYEPIKTVSADSSSCNSYILRVLEEEAMKAELEKKVQSEFFSRFKSWKEIRDERYNC